MASRQPCAVLLVDRPGASSMGFRTSGPLKLVVANLASRAKLQAFLANAGFFVSTLMEPSGQYASGQFCKGRALPSAVVSVKVCSLRTVPRGRILLEGGRGRRER